jgi:hypothetical protein
MKNIIVGNGVYSSKIYQWKPIAYDGLSFTRAVNDWFYDKGKYDSKQSYWLHTVHHMQKQAPSMTFTLNDVLDVNFTNETNEEVFKVYLDFLATKLKYKTYSNFGPWLAMLQDYWLDTNWKLKTKSKAKMVSFGGNSAQTARINPNTSTERFVPRPLPRRRAEELSDIESIPHAADLSSIAARLYSWTSMPVNYTFNSTTGEITGIATTASVIRSTPTNTGTNPTDQSTSVDEHS